MSPKNKKKLDGIRKKLDKLDDRLLARSLSSNLSSFLRIPSNFFLFFGDI